MFLIHCDGLSEARSGCIEFLPILPSQIPPRRAGLTHSSGLIVDRPHGRHILKLLQCRVIGSCAKGSFVFALILDPNSKNKKRYCLPGPVAMSSGSRVSVRMKLDKINRQEFTIGHSLLCLWPLTLLCVSQGQRNLKLYMLFGLPKLNNAKVHIISQ